MALLVFGVATFPNTVHALALLYTAWWLPIAALRFAGMACCTLFLFVFPDGRFVPRWTRPFALAWIVWQIPLYFIPTPPFTVGVWQFAALFVAWPGALIAALCAQRS